MSCLLLWKSTIKHKLYLLPCHHSIAGTGQEITVIIAKYRGLLAGLEWPYLVGPVWHPKCLRKEEGWLLFQFSPRTCRQTVGKLFDFCCMVLNLQWRIQQESCHSFRRNLRLLSVCTHTQRSHTLWSPAGDVVWHMSLLSSFTWAVKLQCRESYIIALQSS